MILGAWAGAKDSELKLPEGFSAAAPPARPDELLDATGDEDAEKGPPEEDTACADGEGERDGPELAD